MGLNFKTNIISKNHKKQHLREKSGSQPLVLKNQYSPKPFVYHGFKPPSKATLKFGFKLKPSRF